MYDIETIRQMNKDDGQNAMDQGLEPLKFNSVDMNNLKGGDITPIRSIPDLGDSVPNGWSRFDLGKIKDKFTYSSKIYKGDAQGQGAFFVDQGFGSENEPAMTIPQFIKSLSEIWNINKRLGFGIVETGQFQVKIGVFEKMKKTMNFKVIFKKT